MGRLGVDDDDDDGLVVGRALDKSTNRKALNSSTVEERWESELKTGRWPGGVTSKGQMGI